MEDIGKELCERVRAALEERNSRNAFMVRLKKEIAEGKATMRDTSLYSQTLGINLRSAIKEVVTPDELPDRTLYYNIAHSILEPLLRDTYEDVNAICSEVQRKLDDKAGIHLAPQKADFPAERVRAACGSASVKDTAEHGIEVLERTGENITAAFSDDYMKVNADFRARAGLDVYIERRTDGKCCPWCTGIAGRYQYGSEPRDIYRRHDNCGCTVECVSSRGRQNVWSKKWQDNNERTKRIEYANNSPDSTKYRAVLRSDVSTSIERNDKNISLRRVTSAVNDIYISDDVYIKPKRFHEIDKKLTEIYKMMGISESPNKPTVYLISNAEMSDKRIIAAAYNGSQNILFLNNDYALYSSTDAPEILSDFVCYKDDRSTYIHELFHWKDAEEYRSLYGEIDYNDPSQYNKFIYEKCKKSIDKLVKKGYNISEISDYAFESLMTGDYSEVYTEYRTKQLLEGG